MTSICHPKENKSNKPFTFDIKDPFTPVSNVNPSYTIH